MVVRMHATPWRNRAELHHVRDQLYRRNADGRDERCEAVDRISMWKLRGAVPHIIESTALLTDAMLLDSHDASSVLSSFSLPTTRPALRLAYACALARFVTGLTDLTQSSVYKQSMTSAASGIGLPLEFVDIRHRIAHDELPSLVELRSMAGRGLEWCWGYYWSELGEGEDAHVDGDEKVRGLAEEFFRKVVAGWIERPRDDNEGEVELAKKGRGRKKRKRNNTTANAVPIQDASTKEMAITNDCLRIAKVCCSEIDMLQILARELLEHGNLIPSPPQQGSEAKALAKQQIEMWDPFLQQISSYQPNFLETLLHELVDCITRSDGESVHEYLSSWITHLACSDTWQQPREHIKDLYSNIICACLMEMNERTVSLAKYFVDRSNKECFVGAARRRWLDEINFALEELGLPLVERTAEDDEREIDTVDEIDSEADAGTETSSVSDVATNENEVVGLSNVDISQLWSKCLNFDSSDINHEEWTHKSIDATTALSPDTR